SATPCAVAGTVYAGRMRSWPAPLARGRPARCSAAVPEDPATAWRVSHARASADSNSATRGPIVSIPSSSTPWTAPASSAPTSGRASRMRSVTPHDIVPEHEHVHLRLQERLDRFLRRHHDRLVLVE